MAEVLREKGANATVEEIVDRKKRSGVLGFIGGGRDAMLGRDTEIDPVAADVASFDLVILGTPVWANTMAPAVRMFILQKKEDVRRPAFLCTMGGSGDKKTFQKMQDLLGKSPVATLALKTRHVKKERPDEYVAKIAAFVELLTTPGD